MPITASGRAEQAGDSASLELFARAGLINPEAWDAQRP